MFISIRAQYSVNCARWSQGPKVDPEIQCSLPLWEYGEQVPTASHHQPIYCHQETSSIYGYIKIYFHWGMSWMQFPKTAVHGEDSSHRRPSKAVVIPVLHAWLWTSWLAPGKLFILSLLRVVARNLPALYCHTPSARSSWRPLRHWSPQCRKICDYY